jgi:hypothetical protein
MRDDLVGSLKHSRHLLRPEHVSMVNAPDFEAAVRRASQDPDTKAFLTIEMLKGIALDPLVGDASEAFYTVFGDTVGFGIKIDRTVNFVGSFSLPARSARTRQLIEAIETNLGSKMFKAAKMSRRLDARRVRLEARARSKGHDAYLKVRSEFGGRFRSQEHKDIAEQAYDSVVEPRCSILRDRVRRVASAASPNFNESYSISLAKFLYWHLPFSVS